jgi:prlF antitoxin for toxin YhaV_toxin
MPKNRKPSVSRQDQSGTTEYRGKQTKTGNSSGFRFEGALFKSHPEFNGEVKARVIAPGRMLVTAEMGSRETADPVMASFLAFLGQDIAHAPQDVRPLDSKLAKRAARLTKGVSVSPNEDLGDEVSL